MRVTQPFDASTLLNIDSERRRRVDFTQGHELVEWPFGLTQAVSLSNGRWAFSGGLINSTPSLFYQEYFARPLEVAPT